ncbi:MAG: hypothetical protein KFE24_02155 [Wolbachia endosymbiont of Homalodisca vitripennis]|nr:hypothetical protein [Wolbachia endosymbiont of Homalodisca vitripennis]
MGSKLSIELDEYKSNFSFMVDVLVSSLKNDNKSNSAAIDGVVELKDKNNDLLDKLFANWQNKQRQLLYICVSLLVVSILLIYSHLKSFAQLAGIIMSIFA